MDLNDLKNTVSNLTLYDLKAGFRKAQNGICQTIKQDCAPILMRMIAVMNYTEMEAKVCSASSVDVGSTETDTDE